MARPKQIIEQTINLSDDVQIVVRWPKGKKPDIDWRGGTVRVQLEGAPLSRADVDDLIAPPVLRSVPVPTSNGPDRDTPEITALKAKLPKPVFTTADAMGLDANEAREFEAALVGGLIG